MTGALAPVDVIIPTVDNPGYLVPCVRSILEARGAYPPVRVLVVNNGAPGSVPLEAAADVRVIEAGRNLGWEGGLQRGLAESDAPFVVFANDDILVPAASMFWLRQLLSAFRDPRVGAAGPSSNCVMGLQSVFAPAPPTPHVVVPYLIGFCLMLRRAALDAAGGVDATLPGGDDLDLSIRLRQAGFRLTACRNVFVYHHGFKTGERVHGADWNSAAMQERTDNALIRKHGLAAWWGLWDPPTPLDAVPPDVEGDTVASWVPSGRVLELGCGDKQTVPWAVGVDQFPGGALTAHAQTSVAQVVADVFGPMPQFDSESYDGLVARHILEHARDPVAVLDEWRRLLRPGGVLVVACPNEALAPTIPMDLDHRHAWDPDSFRTLVERCGFRQVAYTPDSGNGISFVTVVERVG